MPTLVGVADESTTRTRVRAVDGAHRAATKPLDPDALDVSVHVALAAVRIRPYPYPCATL